MMSPSAAHQELAMVKIHSENEILRSRTADIIKQLIKKEEEDCVLEEESESDTESEGDESIAELFPTYIYTGLGKRGREAVRADGPDDADEANCQNQRPQVRPQYRMMPGM